MEKEFTVYRVGYESDIIQITIGYKNYKEALLTATFNELAIHNINVDSVVKTNISSDNSKISFSIAKDEFAKALRVLEASKRSLGFSFADFEVGLAKVTILGADMQSNQNVTYSIFERLKKEDISIKTASTLENQVSLVVVQEDMVKAANALYDEFKL